MLRLEKVNGKNVWDIVKLEVSNDQKGFVAANDISIIEAYTALTGNGYAFPFGIYEDDMPVGFLMIGFDADDYWENAPKIARGNYNLWRLMIDRNYQGKGFGRKAISLALDFINTFPCGAQNTAGYRMNLKTMLPANYTVRLALLKQAKRTGKNSLPF